MKCSVCGAPLSAQSRFCSSCGTPRPALPPHFADAEQRFHALRSRFQAGQIDAAAYNDELRRLIVQDSAGAYWTLGADSGEWYWYDGQQWQQREPPYQPAGAAQAIAAIPSAPAPAPRRLSWAWIALGAGGLLVLVLCVVVVSIVSSWKRLVDNLPWRRIPTVAITIPSIPVPSGVLTALPALPTITIPTALPAIPTALPTTLSGIATALPAVPTALPTIPAINTLLPLLRPTSTPVSGAAATPGATTTPLPAPTSTQVPMKAGVAWQTVRAPAIGVEFSLPTALVCKTVPDGIECQGSELDQWLEIHWYQAGSSPNLANELRTWQQKSTLISSRTWSQPSSGQTALGPLLWTTSAGGPGRRPLYMGIAGPGRNGYLVYCYANSVTDQADQWLPIFQNILVRARYY